MFTTLTVLAALISLMFVASVISAVAELRRENEAFKLMVEKNRAF
jgi:hypothetical protein